MGLKKDFEKEKLIIAILSCPAANENKLKIKLEKFFGLIDFSSEKIEFSFSNYYAKEMGFPLQRFFLSFEKLIEPSRLADIKIITNKLEMEFALDGKRTFNLDPGLMALSRFILASTKNSSHRIPLQQGIYAEIELVFEYGSFRPVEWTYPDYRSSFYIQVLNKIREIYKKNLQAPS